MSDDFEHPYLGPEGDEDEYELDEDDDSFDRLVKLNEEPS